MDGFLNVSKPLGWTSHDVVALIRGLSQTKRVGHAGTLDPAAAGVLLVAVGRATRLVDYLVEQDKSYCGDFVLGAATDTDDAEGHVLYVRDPSNITLGQVAGGLARFLGDIEQVPPQYSAVKIGGRKAYEIARRGGEARMAARRVSIKGLAIVEWMSPVASVLVHASKGTYVRSLARDLGESLGVGCHLGALVRLTVGRFDCCDAVDVDDLRLAAEFGYLDRLLYSPDVAVAHLPAILLSEQRARDMVRGKQWPAAEARATRGPVRVYSEAGSFLGLAERRGDNWQPKLVMQEGE